MSRALLNLFFGIAAVLVVYTGWPAAAQGSGASLSAGSVRIKSGAKLMLDLDTPLNSATARVDDIVWFTARHDVKVDGRLALSRGTPIRGLVIAVKPAIVNGKNQRTEIRIKLEEIPLAQDGGLPIAADILKVQGEKIGGNAASTAQTAVGQATQGAIVGGMISGAKGAVIGAVAAAGVTMVAGVLGGSGPTSDVDLPAGSIFEATLQRPLEIPQPSMLAKTVPKPPVSATSDSATTRSTDAIVDVSRNTQDPPESNETAKNSIPTFRNLEADSDPGNEEANSESAPVIPSLNNRPDTGTPVSAATLKVEVNLVQVEAMVRDRTGKPMSNLRQEDFRIFEDGVEQPIQFFSRDKLPLAIALVIDRSGSVAPLMGSVQTAAYQALQLLKTGDQVSLFAFAGSVELLVELTTNRQRVANRIGGIQAGGGTSIVDAVTEALRYLNAAAPDSRRAVILISDNLEGRSVVATDQAVELALETEAVIYSVKVTNNARPSIFNLPGIPGVPTPRFPIPGVGGNADPVPTLTKETGGEIFDAGRSSITAALTTAIDRLKLRYTLAYPSTDTGAARSARGGYHRIQVQLVSRFGKPDVDYTVHSRSGYYDPASRTNRAASRR